MAVVFLARHMKGAAKAGRSLKTAAIVPLARRPTMHPALPLATAALSSTLSIIYVAYDYRYACGSDAAFD
jgi:hypothetical protein